MFFLTEAKWCGRITSGSVIRHDPTRLQGLVELSVLDTAADLQQFLGAIGWLRGGITNVFATTAYLTELLDMAAKKVGTRKKVTLKAFWTELLDLAAKKVGSRKKVKLKVAGHRLTCPLLMPPRPP